MLTDQINDDIKRAMLSGDKPLVETLKGLKTAIQYAQVSAGQNEQLNDEAHIQILQKERKKRSESAELYKNAGDKERQDRELYEVSVIDKYLPAALDEEQINNLIEGALKEFDNLEQKNMGQLISIVKEKSGGAADGSLIARLVRERIK